MSCGIQADGSMLLTVDQWGKIQLFSRYTLAGRLPAEHCHYIARISLSDLYACVTCIYLYMVFIAWYNVIKLSHRFPVNAFGAYLSYRMTHTVSLNSIVIARCTLGI